VTGDAVTDGEVRIGVGRIGLRVVGSLLLAAGLLLGGQFLWSAPDLMREMQEAAKGEHFPLALMGTLYPGGPTASGVLIGGVGAAVLTIVGSLVLRRARRQ
jgi:hypothetical protein